MARAAKNRRVYYIEEPTHGPVANLDIHRRDGLTIVQPRVPQNLNGDTESTLRTLASGLIADENIVDPVLWYYTPVPVAWTRHLAHSAVVYDVMDELSAFKFAPANLLALEASLLEEADVVLTGGRQLYDSRRNRHSSVHLFPSSVDVAHFARARCEQADPEDQAAIGRPRLGYFGVIDERLDLDLIRQLAARRPDWQVVLVGPIAKIDPADVPQGPNIHHLGMKSYGELPEYLAGWDVAIMPFALNDSTRYISPTKTPEYLAGGRPVVSTPISDVIQPYGANGLVEIGDGIQGFEKAVERALATDTLALRRRADAMLSSMSWDTTWSLIDALVSEAVSRNTMSKTRDPLGDAPSWQGQPVGARAYLK